MKDKDWGVVPKFQLEADTRTALMAACSIVLTETSRCTSWRVVDGTLELLWAEAAGANVLPFQLEGPKELADFVDLWLKRSAKYGKEPDTDVDAKEGFAISNSGSSWHVLMSVKAEWIIYGK